MVGDKEKEALLGTLQMEAINAAAQLPGLDDFRVELDDLFVDAEQKTLGVYYEVFEIPIDSGERFFDGYTIYMGFSSSRPLTRFSSISRGGVPDL